MVSDGSVKFKSRKSGGALALAGLFLAAYLLFGFGVERLAMRSSIEEGPVLLQQPHTPAADAGHSLAHNGTSVGGLRLLFVSHELSLTGAPLALLDLAGRLRSSGHIIR